MKITFEAPAPGKPNPYRNRTSGKLGYRYIVSGTPEELVKYKAVKGEHFRENEKKEPLHFSQDFLGKSLELKFNQEGTKVYADTSEMDMYASLESKWGATIAAEKMAEIKNIGE